MNRRALLGRGSISVGGRFAAALAQAVLLGLMARGLGIEQFGIYAIAYGATSFAMGIADFGLTNRALSAGAMDNRRAFFGTILISRSTTFAGVILAGYAWGSLTSLSPWTLLLVVSSVAAAGGDSLANTTLSIQQGDKKSLTAVVVLLGRRLAGLVPFAFGIDASQSIASMLVLAIVGFAGFGIVSLRRAGRPMTISQTLRGNYTYFFASAGPNTAQLDSVVVGAVAGLQIAGLYGAASRLSGPMSLLITSTMQVVVPEIATERNAQNREQIFTNTRKLAILLAAALSVGAIFAPWVTILVLGSGFEPAWPLVAAVMVAAAISTVSQVYLGWFYATGVPVFVGIGMFSAVILRLLLCALGAALGGVIGLALAIPISQFVTLWVLHYGKSRRRPTGD